MLRTARCVLLFAALPMTGHAEETLGPLDVPAIVGAPFSGVGVTETIRQTADGNRFSVTSSTRYYRDSQGRTRTEREIPRVRMNEGATAATHEFTQIRDAVSGTVYLLNPQYKTAEVVTGLQKATAEPGGTAPRLFTVFGGTRIGPDEPGWSAPVSLGEKSIDGIDAIGTRQIYTISAGSPFGNQKPVIITVEQWFSPALGVVISKTGRASTGGESNYRLGQIVQAEPEASLFTVPADYQKNATQ